MRFLLFGDNDSSKRLFAENEKTYASIRYDKKLERWVDGGSELMDNRVGFDLSEPEESPWRFGNADCMEDIVEITLEEAEQFIGKSIDIASISALLDPENEEAPQPQSKVSRFHIVTGDFFDHLEGKDLIVNSANKYMIYGSGICGQIYKRAGSKQLEAICKNLFAENMKTNEVRITPGLELGIDILHIFCPKRYEAQDPYGELKESYKRICDAASEKHYRHVISISLGTGKHGYTHDEVGPLIGFWLDKLLNTYPIEFTLVLPNEMIKKKYGFYSL